MSAFVEGGREGGRALGASGQAAAAGARKPSSRKPIPLVLVLPTLDQSQQAVGLDSGGCGKETTLAI